MRFENAKPQYSHGSFVGIVCDDTCWPLTHRFHAQFLSWLGLNNKTLEQWLEENPYNPWQDKTLEQYKSDRIDELDLSVRNYVYQHYEQHRQVTLTKLQMEAVKNSKTAAYDYIESCWAWIKSAFNVYYTKAAEIQACITHEQVKNVTWDLSPLDATDPVVTIYHAMELLAA